MQGRDEEMLALVAHELRNPIAALRSAVQLARLRGPDFSELTFDVVDRQSRQLERMLDDLSEYSKLERGVLEVSPGPCAIADVLQHAVAWVEPLRRERSHVIRVTADDGLEVTADRTALQRIVRSLVWNAIQFDQHGGTVAVVASTTRDTAVVEVRDSGVGVSGSLDEVERLFEPFVRTRPRGCCAVGPGLGLTVARGLARLHGGTLTITARPDGGSIAELRLPHPTRQL